MPMNTPKTRKDMTREDLEDEVDRLEDELSKVRRERDPAQDELADKEDALKPYVEFASAAWDDLPRLLDLCKDCKNEPANGVGRFFCENCKAIKRLIDLARETQ